MALSRRAFLKSSGWAAGMVSVSSATKTLAQTEPAPVSTGKSSAAVSLVDTNVHLFEWPFRRLKYARTAALAEKLRRHGVQQAWAGTFEGLLSKDLGGVNHRLAEECRKEGNGMFIPFGSVNPMWPDW